MSISGYRIAQALMVVSQFFAYITLVNPDVFAQETPVAAPAATTPVVAEPADPRTTKPLFKIFVRSEERGSRFIQLGEGGETLPAPELSNILFLSKNEEIQKEMQNHQFWNKANLGTTWFTVATGAGAFIMWGISVSNNEGSSSSALGLFAASAVGIGLMKYTSWKAGQSLYRAQSMHNGKLIDRKKDAVAPPTSSLAPLALPTFLSYRWEF